MAALDRLGASPAPASPVRAAFVGDPPTTTLFGLPAPAAGIIPGCFEPADGAGLETFAPDVVVAFGEDSRQAVTTSVPVLAVIAEEERIGSGTHRTMCWSPSPRGGAWRIMVPPVADSVFRTPTRPHRVRAVAIGDADTLLRDHAFARIADTFDIAAGTGPPPEADVAVYLPRADDGAAHLPLVFAHLAAGHLLLSQALEPAFGLVAGTDYVEIGGPDELDLRMHQLRKHAATYDRVRVQGHLKVRRLRGSVVWPRVLSDVLRDVAAFGPAFSAHGSRRTAIAR